MAALLLTHDAVVCPASTILIESLLLGCAVVTGFFVDNQRQLAEYVQAHHQAYSLGNFAHHPDAGLTEALAHGLRVLTTQPRQPYAATLNHPQLRAEFEKLLSR